MKIIKILHVLSYYYPSKINGTSTLVNSICKALVRKNVNVTIYATDGDVGCRLKENFRNDDNISIRYFKNFSNKLSEKYKICLPFCMFFQIGEEIKTFDIVHIHEFRSVSNIIVAGYCLKHKIPYIIDHHGSLPLGKKYSIKWIFKITIEKIFHRRLIDDVSLWISETRSGINEINEFGIPINKIVYIQPALSIQDFAVLPKKGLFREKYHLQNFHIFLFLGRINYIKGIDFLIDSFAQLRKNKDDVKLIIVGPDDGVQAALIEQIKKQNIEKDVLFTGPLFGMDKLSALQDADVMIQTSRQEAGAWAPFEAILCNTPIIVSSHTGAGEDVKNIDAGYLVEWGNCQNLVDLMTYIISNPEKAGEKTQKAKQYLVNNLSIEKNVEKYLDLYDRCIIDKKKDN